MREGDQKGDWKGIEKGCLNCEEEMQQKKYHRRAGMTGGGFEGT